MVKRRRAEQEFLDELTEGTDIMEFLLQSVHISSNTSKKSGQYIPIGQQAIFTGCARLVVMQIGLEYSRACRSIDRD